MQIHQEMKEISSVKVCTCKIYLHGETKNVGSELVVASFRGRESTVNLYASRGQFGYLLKRLITSLNMVLELTNGIKGRTKRRFWYTRNVHFLG